MTDITDILGNGETPQEFAQHAAAGFQEEIERVSAWRPRKVASDDAAKRTSERAAAAGKLRRELEKLKTDSVKPLKDFAKEAQQAIAVIAAPIKKIEDGLKQNVADYATEQRRIREEQERERQRVAEEARRAAEKEAEEKRQALLNKAAALETSPSGNQPETRDAIDALKAAAEIEHTQTLATAELDAVAEVPVKPEPKLAVHTAKTWKAEIIDTGALIRAIAADESLHHLVTGFNMSALNAMAREMKDNLRFPGVRAVSTETIRG